MAIYRDDGTPYVPTGSIQQFDPEQPEHELFNQWDEEAIKRGGSPIFYYEVLIQPQTVDPIYLEDRGKLFSPIPVQLWCSYDPMPSENLMGPFGIDAIAAETIFELNYRSVLKAIGHPPKLGSRLYTPHLRENWVIAQRNLNEYKMWGALRLELLCQKFQETSTTGEGKVTTRTPDFKIV